MANICIFKVFSKVAIVAFFPPYRCNIQVGEAGYREKMRDTYRNGLT